ncbi:MAG: condensation domain-containing protein, partial [Bacillota bacterium]
EIWKEVLETSKVSINDNFFEIGGHSLKATVLTSKIYKEMAIEVPLSQVFNMPNLKALADYIRNSDKCVYSSIKKAERKDYYPVSSAQRRMFVLNRLEDEGTTYNLPFFRMVKGQLNIKQLEEAFKILIRRHGSLRTSFDVVDNEPVQRIHEHVDFNIIFYEEDEDKLDDIIKIFVKPFDLSKAPLMRVGLVKTGSDSHLFMFDMHHIISDGVSMNILIKELTALYKGKDFPELQLQYNDFSEWQNQLLKTDLIKKQETYWLEVLKGDIPVLNFPTDYQRTPFQTFDGDKVFFEVGESLLESLSNIASKTGATLYMILLAAYNVLLAKYTSQEDIIVGSPTAGRSREDLENIIGMFVNTIVMRSFPSSTKTYLEFLQETKQNALKAFENQDYQFEMLVDKLELNMNHSRNPLFDVFFAYENLDISEIKLGEAEFIPYEYKNRISKFDITLFIGEKKKGLKLEFEYNINLFKRETIERMGVHFINILKQIAQDPLITLSEIDILTHQERSKILFDFNNNQVEHDFSKTIHSLFEEAVKKGPGNIALCIGEEELTYRGLNEKSNQMARSLREKGVRPGSIIGIMA